MANAPIPPTTLWRYMGEKFMPTEQQAAVIGAEPGPLLVVAGAGAGKTETMASRVVWLVANGFVRPEEVLGLTFTRKAAQELGKRIRMRLEKLAADEQLVRRLDPTGALAKNLTAIAPTVSTYDAYAGNLIREYGLLVPVEPDARLITDAELHAIAWDVVSNHGGALLDGVGENPAMETVVDTLLGLITNVGNELFPYPRLGEEADAFVANVAGLPRGKRQGEAYNQTVQKWVNRQQLRRAYADMAFELGRELRERGVVTFNEQMSVAAQMAAEHPAVGASQRDRFRVVMLDEYQDTSHAQRVLLRSLFGENRDDPGRHPHPLTVTAVGDPMQAIYGWRGATAANLAAFVEDFPLPDGSPAPKAQLTTSWRNPPEVLAAANSVSAAVLGTPEGGQRAVEPLTSKPDAHPGTVELGFYATEDEEIAAVADALAADFRQRRDAGQPVSSAVLVRKNKHSAAVAEALEERGVPYEIVGIAGLLTVPEVADTVAVARMLVHPQDSAAALRILAGPACGLGLKDISALASRAVNLAGERRTAAVDELPADADPRERLQVQLAELIENAENAVGVNERSVGLGDAVADLGEPERYSPEGLVRLQALAAKLRALRTRSLGKRLPDLFDDIVSTFGIRTEVLSRPSQTGTVHLDKFAETVASYPGADIEGFLAYLDLAAEHEDGLEPGSVTTSDDRVQILTAHKAKGLEWDTVAVIHADTQTYKVTTETFLTYVKYVPDDAYDVFDSAEDRSEFQKLSEEYIAGKKGELEEETARLFYVAVTRAAERLLVTGSAIVPDREKHAEPYPHFLALRDVLMQPESVPAATVVHWWEGGDAEEEPPSAAREGTWPHFSADPASLAAAEQVNAARDRLPDLAEGELYSLWESDTQALIEEHEAAQRPAVPVVMPATLTASDIVALRADPEQFARRARRPVPFKPNAYAKRGTAFHEWIEGFFGARPLLDDDELPGNLEPDVDADTLVRLKENFSASQWATRTPAHIEHPFEIDLGTSTVRGRIDAVFEDEDGWTIVDWKTGNKPQAAEMRAAKLQLAVYREAWRRIAADDRPIRAVFFYVRTGEDFSPSDLPERGELEDLLRSAAPAGLES